MRRFLAGSGAAFPSPLRRLTRERASRDAVRPDRDASPRRRHGGPRCLREGPQGVQQRGDGRRGDPQVGQRGRELPRGRAEVAHGGLELVEEAGEAPERLRDGRAAVGGRDGRVLGLRDEVRHVLAAAAQDLQHLTGLAPEVGERLPLLGEQPQHLVRGLDGRDRAPDGLVDVAAAGREADAELGEDDREALRDRPARDVEDEVGRDRRRRLLDGDQRARLQQLARTCPAGSPRSTRRSATAG